MLLSVVMVRMMGINQAKYMLFYYMPLSIKNVLDERGKKSQETGWTGIKFLAT